MEFKQLTTPSDYNGFTEEQLDMIFKWANNTKHNRPSGMGLNGMPLLSIGRCIEHLIDHGVPLKELMLSLASDFNNNPSAQLIDVLWDCMKIILSKPKIPQEEQPKLAWINPGELKPRGGMQQWIGKQHWKQLSETEMSRIWKWASMTSDTTRVFYSEYDKPMLSIGRLLEFLTDNGMSLSDIFKQCTTYENKDWCKMQLIDVLWEKVKLVLKLPVK